jgi:Bacteriophage lambda head decoration protein D
MSSRMPHPAFGGTVSALVYNHLFMPGKDPILAPWKFKIGQSLQAGSVLGVITATGQAVLSVAAAGDGSEVPRGILIEDLDTTADAVPKTFNMAVEGYFNETALIFGAGHNPDTARIPLRDGGIYLSAPRYSFA